MSTASTSDAVVPIIGVHQTTAVQALDTSINGAAAVKAEATVPPTQPGAGGDIPPVDQLQAARPVGGAALGLLAVDPAAAAARDAAAGAVPAPAPAPAPVRGDGPPSVSMHCPCSIEPASSPVVLLSIITAVKRCILGLVMLSLDVRTCFAAGACSREIAVDLSGLANCCLYQQSAPVPMVEGGVGPFKARNQIAVGEALPPQSVQGPGGPTAMPPSGDSQL